MPCTNLRQVFFDYDEKGKKVMQFSARKQWSALYEKVPCGQCNFCRLQQSRQIGIRAYHEASLYEHNCFLTLTYSPEFLPEDGSLDPVVPSKFIKRLRRYDEYRRKRDGLEPSPIRAYYCGEYGKACISCGLSKFKCKCDKYVEQLGRPHYHVLLFNYKFEDQELFKIRLGNKLYTSELLSKLWPYGFSTIGELTFQSACYTARYSVKKITGKKAEDHYKKVLPTGELVSVIPEFAQGSRRPGLGRGWLDRYGLSDVYNDDRVVLSKGIMSSPPRYYDKWLQNKDEDLYADIKQTRYEKNRDRMMNSNEHLEVEARLASRQKIYDSSVRKLVRVIEEGE